MRHIQLGPIIGGSLSRPHEQFPSWFGESEFHKQYPYFLACAVPATFSVVAWLVTYFFLKETHPDPIPVRKLLGIDGVDSKEALSEDDVKPKKNHSLKATLTNRVAIAAANYAFLSLIDIAFRAVQPLFLSTPIALGGLGLSPSRIGNVLSVFGVLNGVFQVFFFARIHDRWGSKRVFVGGVFLAIPTFLCFPLMTVLVQRLGLTPAVWFVVYLQVVLSIGISLSYGRCISCGIISPWCSPLAFLRRDLHLH